MTPWTPEEWSQTLDQYVTRTANLVAQTFHHNNQELTDRQIDYLIAYLRLENPHP